MTINEGMRKFRLANPTTGEDLEMRFSGMDGKVLTFGDRVLVAGYYYNGRDSPPTLERFTSTLTTTFPAREPLDFARSAMSSTPTTATRSPGRWRRTEEHSGAGTALTKHTLGIQSAASEHPEPQGARNIPQGGHVKTPNE